MTTAINRMTESASQSSDRARETAEAAKQGELSSTAPAWGGGPRFQLNTKPSEHRALNA